MPVITENPGTLLAGDIMNPNVQTLTPQTSVPEGIHELLVRRLSEMPIVDDNGTLRGIFSEQCCMKVLATLVNLAPVPVRRSPTAADVMVPRRKLLTVPPELNVHTAMDMLLHRGCSGSPVVDSEERFWGTFSERTCMGFVVEAAYNNLPGATVREFTDPSKNRLIAADTDLHKIAGIFMNSPYGRIPIMEANRIAGQVSRRDVLRHSGVLACIMKHHLTDTETEHVVPLPEEAEAWSGVRKVLPDYTVSDFMNDSLQKIEPGMNLFSIARLFLMSPFRRFPVVKESRLVGQISRCDILRKVLRLNPRGNH